MQKYFTANFPSTALGGATAQVFADQTDLTLATVNLHATAVVPMTFMQLVGVNQITVAVDNQIKKTVGLEVALVLDNTGSMLCGANGEPNYDTATCSGGDKWPNKCLDATGWPNGNIVLNGSRICELTNAANNFVTTVFSGVTSNQQLYMAVVPYVTQVNVGAALCTGPTTCTSIAKDASGHFTDETGSVIYKQ